MLCIASFVACTSLAEASPATPDARLESGRWSLGATLHLGPLEDFPRAGLSVDGLYHFGPRLRLGGRWTYYMPRTYGNVQRNALVVEGLLQTLLIDSQLVDWYFGFGLGVGAFHDDYLRVYEDVTRLVPGTSLESGIEVRATQGIRPFLGGAFRAFFSGDLTDSQWLELTTGVRFVF
jgi:hypothetical protein